MGLFLVYWPLANKQLQSDTACMPHLNANPAFTIIDHQHVPVCILWLGPTMFYIRLLYLYIPSFNFRAESARRLDEVQASQKEEILQLETKLAEEKEMKVRLTQVKVTLEQESKEFREELKKK